MTIEVDAAKIIGGAFVDAFGGSIVLAGLVSLVGIGILMKKLEFGISSGLMVAVLIIGVFADHFDSNTIWGYTIPGNVGIMRLFFLLLVIGAAVYWAIFLRRR